MKVFREPTIPASQVKRSNAEFALDGQHLSADAIRKIVDSGNQALGLISILSYDPQAKTVKILDSKHQLLEEATSHGVLIRRGDGKLTLISKYRQDPAKVKASSFGASEVDQEVVLVESGSGREKLLVKARIDYAAKYDDYADSRNIIHFTIDDGDTHIEEAKSINASGKLLDFSADVADGRSVLPKALHVYRPGNEAA
ncbi:MAG: hypothetical protein O3C63_02885 [Cyanobacteria bacterium]|nr:hypothetical protein [Cyanobacteriota bacterium]